MFSIRHNRTLATIGVVAGLLVVAAPAAAQQPVSDGTSNTVMFLVDGPVTAKQPSGFSWSEHQTGTACWDHSGEWNPTNNH